MSQPTQTCETCNRTRQCHKHYRAEFPPDAAKDWLKRTCPEDGSDCVIKYTAGVSYGWPYRR